MKKYKLYLVAICWLIPMIIALNILSNMGLASTKINANYINQSIPMNCNISNGVMKCDDKVFPKEAIMLMMDIKKQIADNILKEECRIIVINKDYKDFLPTKYVTPDEDFKITVGCMGSKNISQNIFLFGSHQINNNFVKNQGCTREVINNPTLIKSGDSFDWAPMGKSYICEDNQIIAVTDMYKKLFIQECYLRLIQDEKEPKNTCEDLYSVLSEIQQKFVVNDSFMKQHKFEKVDFLK